MERKLSKLQPGGMKRPLAHRVTEAWNGHRFVRRGHHAEQIEGTSVSNDRGA
jgi:hypothetical protein